MGDGRVDCGKLVTSPGVRLWRVVDRRDGSVFARRRSRVEASREVDAAPWSIAQYLDVAPPEGAAAPHRHPSREDRAEAVAARLRPPVAVPGYPDWEAEWSVRDRRIRLVCQSDAYPATLPTAAAVADLVGEPVGLDPDGGTPDGWREITYRLCCLGGPENE